tara:strand:+ start:49 stop:378 length:330 start_codon:yes stop_codon:yes gene_type:complete
MNIFILKAMRYLDNPELFTNDEMWENVSDAADADAYSFANTSVAGYDADYATVAAANATADTANAYSNYGGNAYVYEYIANRWINEYFKATGEDKQAYINEVERLKWIN